MVMYIDMLRVDMELERFCYDNIPLYVYMYDQPYLVLHALDLASYPAFPRLILIF